MFIQGTTLAYLSDIDTNKHKQVLEQYAHGEYEINQIFYDEYARLIAT